MTEDQCFPVGELVADSGPVSGNWNTCGVADQFDYACNGPNCSNTRAISTWPCADPVSSTKERKPGLSTYVFVAPIDGTCTFIEYGEGIKHQEAGITCSGCWTGSC